MQTFYFHLKDGSDVLLDPDGRNLPSLAAVAASALREARSLIAADTIGGTIDLDQWIDVEDESGTIVHSLCFADAIEVVRRKH